MSIIPVPKTPRSAQAIECVLLLLQNCEVVEDSLVDLRAVKGAGAIECVLSLL
jgi:hypothetical protein